MERSNSEGRFEQPRDLTGDAVWACVVYSLVPYLGIVFLPFALASSVILVVSRGNRRGRMYFAFGVVIAFFQIFLWWLLYFIPTVGI